MIYALIGFHIATAFVLLWSLSFLSKGERPVYRGLKVFLMVMEFANATYLINVTRFHIPPSASHNNLVIVEAINHFLFLLVFLTSALYKHINHRQTT